MSRKTIDNLNHLIADLTVFYQKLRHYHWNVKGPEFFRLHEKFELMYDEVNMALDEVAERVVGLDGTPYHTLQDMLDNTSLQEDPKTPAGDVMVDNLVKDITLLNGKIQDYIDGAESDEDRTTANMLDEIKDGLEAHLWMLKAWQK